MTDATNHQILLVRRPEGRPRPEDFRPVDAAMPSVGSGELLLQTLYVSLDPYMRGRMNDNPDSYAPSYALDAPPGGGTVARIVTSRRDGFATGDLVVAGGGWQAFSLSDGSGLRRLPREMADPSLALGALGMTGFTAWYGLTAIGAPRPGETLVVSAASGAVGGVVGQIGRVLGCRVVGIAGGPEKCRHVVGDLGFDACLDYRLPDLAGRIAAAAPDGVDIYFENVGGAVREALWPHLNVGARVPVCGLVSGYNGADQAPSGDVHDLLMSLVTKRIRLEGFMNGDHVETSFADFERQMQGWLETGQVRPSKTVVEGLDNAPEAFIGLFEGRNTGKLMVKVAG